MRIPNDGQGRASSSEVPRTNARSSGNILLTILLFIALAAAVYFWLAARNNVSASAHRGAATLVPQTNEAFHPFTPTENIEPTSEDVAPIQFDVEDIFAVAEQFKPAIARALAQTIPIVTTGAYMSARLTSGLVAKGRVSAITTNELSFSLDGTTNRVILASLDAWDRLKIDTSVRVAWSHYRAATQARESLAQDGLLPNLAYSNMESLCMTAETGDLAAMNELGMRHILGRGTTADPSRGFFMVYAAALAGHPAAQHNLGLLYDKGLAVARNETEALKWISLAAGSGWQPALTYLTNHRINLQRTAQLAAEQRRHMEEERLAYANRLNAIHEEEAKRPGQSVQGFARIRGTTARVYASGPYGYYGRYPWIEKERPGLVVWYDSYGNRHVSSGHK